MVTGGRVLNYLEEFSHPETTVIIVGYQGKVLGNYLRELQRKIYGKYYPVLAKNYGNQRLSAQIKGSAELAFSFKKQTFKSISCCMKTSPQMNCE
jgi:hypothetical protein